MNWYLTETHDFSQSIDISGAGWQRISFTPEMPSDRWYAFVIVEAEATAGDGDSIVYVDSLQFEEAETASDYQFTPIRTLQADFDLSGKVFLADLKKIADNWLASCSGPTWCEMTDIDESGETNLIDYSVLGSEWMLTEIWYEE
jgi:hypothetical protein